MAHVYRILNFRTYKLASKQYECFSGKFSNVRLITTICLLPNFYNDKLLAKQIPRVTQLALHSRRSTSYHGSEFHEHDSSNDTVFGILKYGVFAIIGTILITFRSVVHAEKAEIKPDSTQVIPGLPTYTSKEVSQHDSKEKRIWASFNCGVYDLTDFVDQHPGGDQILLAAGGALDPFWALYAAHRTPQVMQLLEKFRIGNLKEDDRGTATENMGDPYADDPKRHPALKPSSAKPFNAEPPMQLLVESYHTPNDLFFVRNHLPVPHVDENEYRLEVTDMNSKTVTLSLEDLKTRFPKHTISSTVQCAGNRRSELTKVKPVKGLNWGAAAISNASWSGAKLRDVLLYAGLTDQDDTVQHIQFEGLDADVTGVSYGASILRVKAMDPLGDVLVAYEMNGKPIPADHGFPVRVIVPGVVGARNVKWLSHIIMSDHESESHWQQNDYKGFSPNIDWNTVDFKSAPAIQELPVQSAICQPVEGATVKAIDGTITVKGYAWSGGGRAIVRVDVSSDGGHTWHTASFHPDGENKPFDRSWAWKLWKVQIPIEPEMKNNSELQLLCRATDSSYNVQPDSVEPLWNLRGVLNNAWHRVTITIQK